MWTLCRFLPLMVGDKVPEDNAYWRHFLDVIEILDYVLAPTVRENIPDCLAEAISVSLMDFQQLYPNASFLPKMHYITHIPRYLKQ